MTEDAAPRIRAAHQGDIPRVARVLSRAFFDDPVFGWLFPDPERRMAQAARLFAIELAHDYLPSGRVEVAEAGGTVRGATTWNLPDAHGGFRNWLRGAPHYVGLFGTRTPEILRAFAHVGRAAPKEPHYRLSEIGTDPVTRGHGIGAALLRSGLARADAEGTPVFLESSTEANIPLYEHFGFAVTGEITASTMPVMYAMWREPRT